MEDPDYLNVNRASWGRDADNWVAPGHANWSSGEPVWGIWSIPESQAHVMPEVAGRDCLEAGCGTGYVSAWVARAGGRPVGLDPTAEQLTTAARFQHEFDLHYPLVMAAAEAMPFPDESFDVVISEYGAAIWSDPFRWIPEAARVLRPGGELVFLVNGTILMLCAPEYEKDQATDRLLRDYFGIHRFEWPDDDAIDFHIGYGDWIRLLRANDFVVEDLIELRPSPDATSDYLDWVTAEWAQRWPSEEVWKARKVGQSRGGESNP